MICLGGTVGGGGTGEGECGYERNLGHCQQRRSVI